MTESVPSRGKGRWVRYAAIGVATLAVLLLVAGYLASGWFQERMRRRVVAELEQMTGGRAELKSFRWKLSKLEFEARDLTIHGLESADQVPYAHVDRLLVRLKILSLLRRQIGIRELEIEHPVVHLIVYADGSTNQPAPGTKATGEAVAGGLFDLAIDRLQVERGELLWNDQKLPLDFTARGLLATMTRTGLQNTYEARIQVAAVDTKYGEFRPLHGKAELQLGLAPGRAELRSFRLVSDGSVLEARGTLTDFRDPKIQLTYDGSLDVAEFGVLLRIPEVRRGKLEINGHGTYHAPDFAFAGRLVLKGGEWREPGLRVPELTAAAKYSITRDHLVISDLTAQTLGGLVSGSVEVTNWSRLGPLVGAAGRTQARQHGVGRLRLSGVQIGALATAVSTPRLPLDRVNLAGRASGTVDLEWTGSPKDLDATFAVEVAPPANAGPGQLPVTARVQMVYHGRQAILDIAQLTLVTPATRFKADGVLGSTSARLNVALNTSDVAELQSVLSAFHKPMVPADVHGGASFTGSVMGRLAGPTIRGHLEISDFDTDFAAGCGGSSSAYALGLFDRRPGVLAQRVVATPRAVAPGCSICPLRCDRRPARWRTGRRQHIARDGDHRRRRPPGCAVACRHGLSHDRQTVVERDARRHARQPQRPRNPGGHRRNPGGRAVPVDARGAGVVRPPGGSRRPRAHARRRPGERKPRLQLRRCHVSL